MLRLQISDEKLTYFQQLNATFSESTPPSQKLPPFQQL